MIETRKLPGLSERELSMRLPGVLEYLVALDRRVAVLEGVEGDGDKALRAVDMLMDVGRIRPGELPNEALRALAELRARPWAAGMGWIGVDTFVTHEGALYIATRSHATQANAAPGTAGGLSLFRMVRDEPAPDSGEVLDFVIGEFVPYGAVRRDPVDGQVYTPVREQGVTLYDHRPGLVPSEYKWVDTNDGGPNPDPDVPVEETVLKWVDLPSNHPFQVGDRFIYSGKVYVVLRVFNKQTHMAPPALIDDYYKPA